MSTVSMSKTVPFQTIQFNISMQFKCKYSFLYKTIQFSVSTVSMSKTVSFQTIQFGISTQFKSKYSLIVKTFVF